MCSLRVCFMCFLPNLKVTQVESQHKLILDVGVETVDIVQQHYCMYTICGEICANQILEVLALWVFNLCRPK